MKFYLMEKRKRRMNMLNTNTDQKTNIKTNQESDQYIIFTLNNQEFGINVLEGREIITARNLTAIPESPDFVKGIINLRNKIIPIIDLNLRFNLQSEIKREEDKVIIISLSNTLIGLRVKEVEEIIRIQKNKISEAPDITKGVKKDYIQGIARMEDRLLILINIESIFKQEEIKKLQNME